jgi:hypothetical protein
MFRMSQMLLALIVLALTVGTTPRSAGAHGALELRSARGSIRIVSLSTAERTNQEMLRAEWLSRDVLAFPAESAARVLHATPPFGTGAADVSFAALHAKRPSPRASASSSPAH